MSRVLLNGNAKDRRKQLRKIKRDNPGKEIKVCSNFWKRKKIDGKYVIIVEANRPLTEVIIKD